jgi:probable rRNA maturation factor
MPIEIEIANEQALVQVDQARLAEAARRVISGEGIESATVSLAVVDDPRIHALNKQYLIHDSPTDVLSFVLEQSESHLEGEVIVSAETATVACGRFGWSAADELLLYVIHGCLHLAGYDDQTEIDLAAMREREKHYLATFGLAARYDEG